MKITLLKQIFFTVLVVSGVFLQAQTVTGKVTSGGQPLPGANVIVKGTSNGFSTDFDGNYTLENVADDAIIVFSYTGFLTQEVAVNGQTVINVILEEDLNALDEVVVVGYGTQKRSEVTTAISTVSSKDIREIPVADVAQTLQGRAAGVSVINGGSPGEKTAVRIRGLGTFGDGDPLYVIDGVFTNSLNNIDPNSIKKIDVLKDAAAASIYGSRASNGVVIITTNRGAIGKTKFQVSSYIGTQNSNKRYDVLNTSQYVQYIKEINAQTDGGGTTINVVNDDPNFDGNGVETNWQNEFFRNAGMSNVSFNASGGTEKSTFSFGASTFSQEGVYTDTKFNRHTFNANSQFNVTNKLRVGETVSLGFTDRVAPQLSDGREPLFNLLASAPYTRVRNADGSFSGSTDADNNNSRNQLRVQDSDDNLTRNTTIIGSLYGEYDIVDGLTFRSQLGVDIFYSQIDNILRAYDEGGQFSKTDTNVTKIRNNQVQTIFTNSLNFKKTIAEKHNLDITAVYERLDLRFESVLGASTTDISSQIPELLNGVSSSRAEDEILISYLARINYNYDGKYLFSSSIRRDKSSRFFGNEQEGFFPSASIGWVASKEGFLENHSIISNLKFTGSIGSTGNNRIRRNSFAQALGLTFNYPLNGQLQSGTGPTTAQNLDLTWEKSVKQNYGFELGLVNNKYTFSLDYYNNNNTDVLIDQPTIPSAGVPSGVISTNAAEIEVSGFDITFGYNDWDGDFKWNLWANITTSDATVLSTGPNDQILRARYDPLDTNISRLAAGEPLNHFYGYIFDGVYSTNQDIIDDLGEDNLIGSDSNAAYLVQQGDARYRDINGDGDITDEDRVVIGDPNPDFIYSINLRAEYKNFDFSALLVGVQGVDAFNGNIFNLESQENVLNRGTQVLNRWQQPGDITNVPRFRFGRNQNNAVSTRYIEDASYARLRNLDVGYSFRQDKLKGIFNGALTKVRFYVQALNLFTITDYSGLDPEIEPFYNATGIIEGTNIDRGRGPQPTTFLTGLQIEF